VHLCNFGEIADTLIHGGHGATGSVQRIRAWVAGIVVEGDQRPEIINGESEATKLFGGT
jgi:hypothetical protein